jgi:hypothetical protein
MYTVRNLVRDASDILQMPYSDLEGRMRAAREAGLVSQRARGRGAASATPRDAAVLLLAPFVAKGWADVPDGVRRYGDMKLMAARCSSHPGEEVKPPFGLKIGNTSLLDALTMCLEECGFESGVAPLSLRGVLSDNHPEAFLTLSSFDNPNRREEVITLLFQEPRSPKEIVHRIYSFSFEVHQLPLLGMIDLLAAKADKRQDVANGLFDDTVGAVA